MGIPQLENNLGATRPKDKIRYKDEIHAGEHAAIVDPRVWRQVQDLLRQHGHGRDRPRTPGGALLAGAVALPGV
jgi:hypothetical protein